MSRVAILRLKALVAEHGPLLVLCLALPGAAMLGVAAWEYTNPTTTEITDRTNQQTVRSELHTTVIASGNTTLYEPGTELVDQPTYLRSSSHVVTLTQRTDVPTGEPVHVDQRIAVRHRVTRDGTVFWEESRVLASDETTTSNGTVVSKTSLDVRDIESRTAELASDIGDAGELRTQLVVTLSYETQQYAGELSEPVPIEIAGSWYAIDAPVLQKTHDTPVTRQKPIPTRNPAVYGVPGALGALLLAAAGGVAIGYHRGIDPQAVEQRLQALRFTEWISAGSVPDASEKTTVALDSLADLVDTAIDTDGRVIHDERRDVYVVLDGDVVYQYHPDGFCFEPSA